MMNRTQWREAGVVFVLAHGLFDEFWLARLGPEPESPTNAGGAQAVCDQKSSKRSGSLSSDAGSRRVGSPPAGLLSMVIL